MPPATPERPGGTARAGALPRDPTPPVLCLVTDRARLAGADPNDLAPLLALIASAAEAGIDLVQIREPGLADRALGDLVARAVERTRGTRTRVVVNDRVDVALAHGAAGVHLKGASFSAARVRARTPAGWIVGRSIHGLDEGVRATAAPGLDYVLLGTVFETASKPGRPPVGAGALRRAAEMLPVPVLAIGGVTLERVPEVAASGAAGLAAIGLFAALGGAPPAELRRLVGEIRCAWAAGRRPAAATQPSGRRADR